MITPGELKINYFFKESYIYYFNLLSVSATGDPDTPISEGEDDLGNTQGGNG